MTLEVCDLEAFMVCIFWAPWGKKLFRGVDDMQMWQIMNVHRSSSFLDSKALLICRAFPACRLHLWRHFCLFQILDLAGGSVVELPCYLQAFLVERSLLPASTAGSRHSWEYLGLVTQSMPTNSWSSPEPEDSFRMWNAWWLQLILTWGLILGALASGFSWVRGSLETFSRQVCARQSCWYEKIAVNKISSPWILYSSAGETNV